MNQIERVAKIKNEYEKYLKSSLQIKDNEFSALLSNELSENTFFKGPFLSFSLPFVVGRSIEELVRDNFLSSQFNKINSEYLDKSMKLYKHQIVTIDKINKGHNVVLSTGTGSGKTEAFLIPILNTIMNDIESGNDSNGIKAIFLYPMNALINDQMERIRGILKNYHKITFGSFTGETPESSKDVKNRNNLIPNEIVDRETLRENTPNLLFTNYSMLEYILLRPDDSNIFTEKNIKNWKFIVIDEAHTYQGALAIELSHLLNRLRAKYSKNKIQFVLTSATLANDSNNLNNIVNFSSSLTSSNFNENDIVFGFKEDYSEVISKYKIKPEIYSKIKRKYNDTKEIASIFNQYISYDYEKEMSENLYNLIINDSFFKEIVKLSTSKRSLSFKEIVNLLNSSDSITEEQLIDYIDLVSFARMKGRSLIEIKFNTFVRSPQGAFATFEPRKNLRLIRTKELNGLKYLEIAICKYCSSTYIMASQKGNKIFQNDKVDIYENYGSDGNFSEHRTDFFLVKGKSSESVEFEDSHDESQKNAYFCNKCGFYKESDEVSNSKCDCDQIYRVDVIKIERNNKLINNITNCIVCNRNNRYGVLKSFNVQKDEATALLTQINLRYFNLKENQKKQMIAFSDSVQQASFFATFMENNYYRFLRKRVLVEILNSYSENSVNVSKVIEDAIGIYSSKELVDVDSIVNKNEVIKTQAYINVLTELMLVDGDFSGEGLGLYAFRNNKLDFIKDDYVNICSKYKALNVFSRDEVYNLASFALDIFRTSSAIKYEQSDLDKDLLEEELLYRSFDTYVTKQLKIKTQRSEYESKNVRSFLPIKKIKNSNKLISYIGKILESNDLDYIYEVASCIWELAIEKELFFKGKFEEKEDYKIKFENYSLINGKSLDWHQCEKCKRISYRNIRNFCSSINCDGKIKSVNTDKVFEDNYYRNEYINMPIERIIIKEHTSQIGKKKGRDYQNEFKTGRVNILSSSTTFEMGIDIGSLDNVFLRNVPPKPSNYSQRAGRAGRRVGSTGFIITYCGNSSHDFNYFLDPTQMINGIIKTPYFKTDNYKIINRHLAAAAFSFFFKFRPDIYGDGKMRNFIKLNGFEEFEKYINSEPKDLIDYAKLSLLEKNSYNSKNIGWMKDLLNEGSGYKIFKDSILSEIGELKSVLEEALKNSERNLNLYTNQLDSINEQRIIEVLSRNVVIPKYGFPIDVVELKIDKDYKTIEEYEPTRDLSIAISEYAPESEVVIDKLKYKSRYIVFPRNSFSKLRYKFYVKCNECNRYSVDYSLNSFKFISCIHCNSKNLTEPKKFIIPSYGFRTENVKSKDKTLKPQKTYSSVLQYLGGGKVNPKKYSLGSNIQWLTSENDELMSINENPFYTCTFCGYTSIERNRIRPSNFKKEHKNRLGFKCEGYLTPISLAHTFLTDAIKFDFKELKSVEEAYSVLFAFLDSISHVFNIERNDINGTIVQDKKSYSLIIFDNVPGGAGYVKKILDSKGIEECFKRVVEVTSNECCDLETSCYNCLRNYKNQSIHHYLKRGLALQKAKIILSDFYDKKMIEIVEKIDSTPKMYKENEGINLIGKSKSEINQFVQSNFDEKNRDLIMKIIQVISDKNIELEFSLTTFSFDGKFIECLLYWETFKVGLIIGDNNIEKDNIKLFILANYDSMFKRIHEVKLLWQK
jgi:ATP-dependent helicase YprA (DUF1998 family)